MAYQDYWASKQGKDLAREIQEKFDKFGDSVRRGWYYARIKKMRRMYYGFGGPATSFGISKVGPRGEMSAVHVNMFRQFVQQFLGLVTAQKIDYYGEPENQDSTSQIATDLASRWMQSVVMNHNVDRVCRSAAEYGCIDNQGFTHVDWDHTKGEPYWSDEEGNEIPSGDFVFDVVGIDDIAFDPAVLEEDQQWKIVRKAVNRHDLCAKYPHLEDKIKNAPAVHTKRYETNSVTPVEIVNEDLIYVLTCYHVRSASVPEGLKARIIDNDTLLTVGPIDTQKVPVHPNRPSTILGTSLGYSPANDMLCLNDTLNVNYMVALSNAINHGNRNILSPEGNKVRAKDATGGGNWIEYTIKPPEVMDQPATSPEIFSNMDRAIGLMQQQLGLNDLARGQLSASSRIASDVVSMAQQSVTQFAAPFQESYSRMVEDVGNSILQIFKRKAKSPRLVSIVGDSGRPAFETISADSFKAIDRVRIKTGNPLLITGTQRYDAAKTFLEQGIIKDPAKWDEFIRTGQVTTILQDEHEKAMQIKGDCEKLAKGIVPIILASDDHALCIKTAINTVLSSQSSRENSAIVEAVNSYVQQHLELGKTVDPLIAAVMNHTPVNMPPPPQGAPQGQPSQDLPPDQGGAPPIPAAA